MLIARAVINRTSIVFGSFARKSFDVQPFCARVCKSTIAAIAQPISKIPAGRVDVQALKDLQQAQLYARDNMSRDRWRLVYSDDSEFPFFVVFTFPFYGIIFGVIAVSISYLLYKYRDNSFSVQDSLKQVSFQNTTTRVVLYLATILALLCTIFIGFRRKHLTRMYKSLAKESNEEEYKLIHYNWWLRPKQLAFRKSEAQWFASSFVINRMLGHLKVANRRFFINYSCFLDKSFYLDLRRK